MKRPLRLLLRAVLVLLVCWLCVCLLLAAIIVRTGAIDEPARSDVIIVLGAALTRDGKPYKALTRRSEHAADVWKKGRAAMILCMGGIGPHVQVPRSEADACREILMADGVPRSAILLEERSGNTEAQALAARRIMAAHGWKLATLVSDIYHMFRARLLARRAGVEVVLSPVPASRIDGPAPYVFALVREVMALQWQVLK
jgi:uncharacterized SAM-binding protein YcdF (DUF218 family)